MAEDVWILGIHMTKFGKHPDKDTLDLATEAALAALADGGVTANEMGVVAFGNLMGGLTGQALQKQIGQNGAPVFNVMNACAIGATALRAALLPVKAGECDYGLAVGVEKLAGAGLLGARPRRDKKVYEPKGRAGAVASVGIGTQAMPGVFAQMGMEYLYEHPYDGSALELFARISEKNHAHSTLNPLAAYQTRFTLEEIMAEPMMAYPNTRPMCSANCDGAAAAVVVSGAKLRTLEPDQRRRAVKVSASVLTSDPWSEAGAALPDVNTLTRNAAAAAYAQSGVAPSDLDLVELHDCFATAELIHYDNLGLCAPGSAVDYFLSGATWRDGLTRSTSPAGSSPRGTPSPPPASPTSGRSATTSGAKPATARSRGPRWAWPTSSGSARRVASTSSRRRPDKGLQGLEPT